MLAFLMGIVVYSMRNDLSFAIVCMVNTTAMLSNDSTTHNVCTKVSAQLINDNDDRLLWSKAMQGSVLSSFYWGYLLTQIIGGYLSLRYGPKSVIGIAVTVTALLTLISPISATTNFYCFLIIRAIIGLFHGLIYPAMHTLLARWTPPDEASFICGLAYSGKQQLIICKKLQAAIKLAMLLSCLYPPYYANMVLRLAGHPYSTLLAVDIPWRQILTSSAVWATLAGHWASDFGAYIMMTSLPTFLSDVRGMDITSMGAVAALPYVLYCICITASGAVADLICSSGWLSVTNTRRIAIIIAFCSQVGFLIATGYLECDDILHTIIYLTLGIGLSGMAYTGYLVNYLDIAPIFAGQLLGIGNTLSCIAGILAPLLVGLITSKGTVSEWRTVFFITSAVLAVGGIIFCCFVNGEVQPWALPRTKTKSLRSTEDARILNKRVKNQNIKAFRCCRDEEFK
ncbi:unnamed protein product [Thelazia callipaeda]|uniref:MFS domain-containing protein n=1 Tax=Thelazia callipaeda TaxID=103827 RepID=A0A0N5CYZ9_THECL|nr:unnamed protein product [Thelazia callipaeda]